MSDPASEGFSPGAIAYGARGAGIVVASGYALGLAPGPIIAALGGLALSAIGRGMLLARRELLLQAVSFGLLAAALGLGAFRWGSLGRDALIGAQAVLGATVLVGPVGAAVGAWAGAAAATVALALLLGAPQDRGWIGTILEAVAGGLVVSVVFFKWQPLILWLASAAGVAVVTGGGSVVARRVGRTTRWVLLGAGVLAVVAGSALTATAI